MNLNATGVLEMDANEMEQTTGGIIGILSPADSIDFVVWYLEKQQWLRENAP